MSIYIAREGNYMTDLYRTDERYERELKNLDSIKFHSKPDQATFIRFLRSMQAQGIGYVQLLKYIQSMRTFLKSYSKPFAELTKEDLENFLIFMQPLKPKTRKIKWYAVKKFFDYIGLGKQFFKARFVIDRNRLPEQIFTRMEIDKLIEALDSDRNKALCAVLYESGARIGELLMVKKKDVAFDNDGAVIMLSGKTGQRRVRIVQFAPLLKKYILTSNIQSDDRIFNICYNNAANILREAAWSADIRKPVNPHAFRHARATHLANFLTESQLKEFFGWRQGSEMAQIYVHLSGRDLDTAILKMHGIEPSSGEADLKKRMGIG